ncbi:hypothetical protein GIB67_034015, partial [Kingdonia uniflora]
YSSLLAASYPSRILEGYLEAHSIHKHAFQEYTKMMLRRRSLEDELHISIKGFEGEASTPHQHQKYF